jgi:EAL and modified HD-GYP domain-containing signal transduction protein
MAMELDSMDDLERALQLGVTLAAGRVDRSLFVRHQEGNPLQHNTLRLCQLLNDVALDRDTSAVAHAIRIDVGLSYKLLRYVNSPAVGLPRGVESVDQAVMVLGRNELYRWLSVLLLASMEGRFASIALQEMALARARLLEGLAEQRADAINHPPAALFTVGLLSLLSSMLQLPLAQVLEPLRLSDTARQALLDRSGPWAPYLELVTDLERHDMASAAKHATAFGGMATILELSDAAWVWAAEVSKETGEP